jgi:hypothetical protein
LLRITTLGCTDKKSRKNVWRLFGAAFLMPMIMTTTTYDKTTKLPTQQQLSQDEAIALLLLRQQPSRHVCVSEGTRMMGGIRK